MEKSRYLESVLSNVLNASFKTGEIARVKMGLTFIKWALRQVDLCGKELYMQHYSEEEFEMYINRVINTIEDYYPVLRDVLSSLIPSRSKKDMKSLRAIFEAYQMKEWNEYPTEELVVLFNELVVEENNYEDMVVTPASIRKLIVKIIDPKKNMKVGNLFSGTGSCLLEVNAMYNDLEPVLYGEEISFEMYGISNMLLIINGIHNGQILQGNVYDRAFFDKEAFDTIIIDAPFGMSAVLRENGSFKYGLPAKSSADWANYQIAVYKLKSNGKAIVTASVGALNRSTDAKIREGMVNDDLIEAVITLPGNLYAQTTISTALIIFNKQKSSERKNKIIMIDASEKFNRRNRRQNELTQDATSQILELLQNWQEVEQVSMIVDLETLRNNEYNLNSCYYLNAKVIQNKLKNSIYLKDIAEVLPGVQVAAEELNLLKTNTTHYFLNVKNIQEDEIIYDEDERIRDKSITWYGKYDIQSGDIIMTTKGTTTKVTIVSDDFKPAFISNNLTIIRVKRGRYSPQVLMKYLKSELGKLVLESIATGAGIRVINASKLEGIRIPNYDVETCMKLGERIKASTLEYQKSIEAAKEKFAREEAAIKQELGF